MSYLLDTSVVTRLGRPEIVGRIRELDGGGIARSTLTDLEVGYSARNAEEWDRLQAALGAFRPIDVQPAHVRRAGQVQRMLAERGLRGRKVPDLVIAAVGEAESLTVLHYDVDFELIAGVTGQPAEWVVPRGSID